MRKTRKPLITAMCVLVLTLGVNATYAWLTDTTEAVTNTFTVGNIDIDLYESDDLNLKMVPGQDITKDPIVTVKGGSEDCWLFVKVDESTSLDSYITYVVDNEWTELTEGSGIYYRAVAASDDDQLFSVLKDDKVTVLDTVTKTMMDAIDGKVDSKNAAGIDKTAEQIDAEQKSEIAKRPSLTFTAYAVQKASFSDTTKTDAENAKAAWTAYGEQNA